MRFFDDINVRRFENKTRIKNCVDIKHKMIDVYCLYEIRRKLINFWINICNESINKNNKYHIEFPTCVNLLHEKISFVSNEHENFRISL